MDRRRINGPAGGTLQPVYVTKAGHERQQTSKKPIRTRQDHELRKIFLQTGLTPSASGSAYLELQSSDPPFAPTQSLAYRATAPKLTCVVHGPRPLPRSAAFSPHIVLSTNVKYAPFASRQRRGYLRDTTERDLAAHLETALRGMIIAERWPKSSVEVMVTILEGDEDWWSGGKVKSGGSVGSWGTMSILAACVTVASAAIADAGIDCVDLVVGGAAALLRANEEGDGKGKARDTNPEKLRIVLDPAPSEHADIQALCVVGYMISRDELTEIWMNGQLPDHIGAAEAGSEQLKMPVEELMDQAVGAATAVHSVLREAVQEASRYTMKHAG